MFASEMNKEVNAMLLSPFHVALNHILVCYFVSLILLSRIDTNNNYFDTSTVTGTKRNREAL